MIYRKIKVFVKKYIYDGLNYFALGFFLIFLLHVTSFLSIDGSKGIATLNTPFFQSLYSNLVFQGDRFLSITPPLILILGFLLLIHRLYKKRKINSTFFLWAFCGGSITWLIIFGYQPKDPYIFALNAVSIITSPQTIFKFSFSSLFNNLTVILLALLLMRILIKIKVWCKANIIIKNPPKDFKLFKSKPKKTDEEKEEKLPTQNNNFGLTDNPLSSIKDLKHIRKTTGEESLFENFEENINKLFNLVTNQNISDQERSITVCLDGPWGSGKTSLVNILEKKLQKNKVFDTSNIAWTTFNPWGFNNKEELIKDFFKTLSLTLHDKFGENFNPDFSKYAELITPSVESSGIPTIFTHFLKLLPFFKSKDAIKIKQEIKKRLQTLDGKVVILIDDIDRLEYKNINLMIKLVKENLDFPKLLFILPFDYERVTDLIVKQRKNCDFYRSFLQKIINFKFNLKSYSYRELSGVFFTSVIDGIRSMNSTQGAPDKKTLDIIFDWYFMAKTRNHFVDVREKEDSSESQVDELKPLFSFYKPLFDCLVPQYSYSGEYSNIKKDIVSILTRHITKDSPGLDDLITGLYKPIKPIAIRSLTSTKTKKVFDDMAIDIGLPEPEKNDLWGKLNPRLTDINSENNRLTDVTNLLNELKQKYTSLQTSEPEKFTKLEEAIKTIISLTKVYVDKYEIKKESDVAFITDQLVKDFTPRDVKQIAQKLVAVKNLDWSDQKLIKNLIEEVAEQQI